jgi:2-polyprenyl-3-methyl-5-hydroxy-6-metoxy-1,4-benzoquinol methylase
MLKNVKYHARVTCELRKENCETCSDHWQKVVRIKDHETNLGEFDVVYCQRCKLGFTDPYPTEETSKYLYEEKESSDFDVIRHSPIDYIKDFLSFRQLVRLAPHNHIRAILDYSTGNGRFAMSAARAFPKARVDAVDYQNMAPQILQTQSTNRNPVNYYELSAFTKQQQQYDLIIVRHVLEHTYHPVQLVQYLANRLSPEGAIYIEVPNLESGCAKIFNKYWKLYYVPRHIFHYTVSSLMEIVHQAGLEGKVGRTNMPLMGNTISIMTGAGKTNLFVQFLGILLYPIQLAIEVLYRSSSCISIRCTHTEAPIQTEYN